MDRADVVSFNLRTITKHTARYGPSKAVTHSLLFPFDLKFTCSTSRRLLKTRKGYKVRSATNKISYLRLRDLIIEAFSTYADDVSSIGTHSLRSGGATAAARAGVPDRPFKRHGRWCIEKGKDGVIQDSVADRVSVSQSLGI